MFPILSFPHSTLWCWPNYDQSFILVVHQKTFHKPKVFQRHKIEGFRLSLFDQFPGLVKALDSGCVCGKHLHFSQLREDPGNDTFFYTF